MSRITDQDFHAATANGDGTHSGVKMVQWLMEATTGKPLSESEALSIIEEAKHRAAQKRKGS